MINNYPIVNIYEKNSLNSKLSPQLIYGEKFKILKKKKDWLKKAEKKIKGYEGRENFNHLIIYLALPLELLKNSKNSLSGDNIIVVPSSPNTFP